MRDARIDPEVKRTKDRDRVRVRMGDRRDLYVDATAHIFKQEQSSECDTAFVTHS